MSKGIHRLAGVVAGVLSLAASAHAGWRFARSDHFEVYSQSGDQTARPVLAWLEQLRAFFLQQTLVRLEHSPQTRVIVFGSAAEFQPYRLRATSDAYSIGAETRGYIVMPASGEAKFSVVAHEYAHLVLHASGLQLPPWLNEGLCEFFSNVRISERGVEVGGDIPERSQALRRRAWMPLGELLALPEESPERRDRQTADLFYAQSWALTRMLALSPGYKDRFQELVLTSAGASGYDALGKVYAKSAEAITADLHSWVDGTARRAIGLPGVTAGARDVDARDVTPFEVRSFVADLLLVSGELDRAEAIYRELMREAPEASDIPAVLGGIAFRKGDYEGARREWQKAIRQGVADAALCYRYAVLADLAGRPADEIRPALERAVELKPDFDDAHYHLALLEKSAGRYEAAVAHLKALREVGPERAFLYWIAMADALNELGRRDESETAARAAAKHATTPAEHAQAAKAAYIAQTDLAVRFERDAEGHAQLVTTRAPHATPGWNPFVEPSDDLHRVDGTLREIDCGGEHTRMKVEAGGRLLTLAIVDPSRVQMRNAPAEFVCGPQTTSQVTVEYAQSNVEGAEVDGIVRGMEFR